MKKNIQVVVGLISNPEGEILLAWRDAHKFPGNCWEFPGGKIEAGETQYQALCRELLEEVGIEVQNARDFPSIYYEYETMQVELHPWRVQKYLGAPCGLEGQQLCWFPLNKLRQLTLPSANYAIIDLLFSEESSIFIGKNEI